MRQQWWVVFGCLSSSVVWSASEPLAASLSFQGYSGLLNTPNTATTDYRTAILQYGDQLERKALEPAYVHGHNYIFSFGLQESLELNARVATDTIHDNLYLRRNSDQSRDLSVNLKYRLPLIPQDWFSLAVGVQDLGGQTDHFDSRYLVASKELGDWRFSAGAAQSDSRLGRMDGVFAGVEWQLTPWLVPLLEYDAADVNLGVRASHSFSVFDLPFRVSLTQQLYSSYKETPSDNWFSVALSVPLGGTHQEARPLTQPLTVNANQSSMTAQPVVAEWTPATTAAAQPSSHAEQSPPSLAVSSPMPSESVNQAKPAVSSIEAIAQLERLLIEQGFEDIEIAESPNQIHVRFENNVYNQNELDALGVVAGLVAATTATTHRQFHLVMKNQGWPVIALRGDASLYLDFLNYPCRLQYIRCVPEANVKALLQVWQPRAYEDKQLAWRAVEGSDHRLLTPRLILSPTVRHRTATEYGTLDSSIALRSTLQLDLWKGAIIEGSYDKPISTTRNYEGTEIYADDRHDEGWSDTSIRQSIKLGSRFLNQTSLSTLRRKGPAYVRVPGYYNLDRDWSFDGVLNQSLWHTQEGSHQFGLDVGRFEQQNFSPVQVDLAIGSYRWFNDEKNLSWQLSYGKFWDQDTGLQITNRYLLGDTDISLTYSDTEVKTINFAITVPLTPRKDWAHDWVAVRGSEAWSLGVTSLIKEPSNYISLAKAGSKIDVGASSLQRAYLNRDRLSVPYIKANLYRMREAFIRYGNYGVAVQD